MIARKNFELLYAVDLSLDIWTENRLIMIERYFLI